MKEVRLLEQELGIRAGFLESIREEDDWSFIIKLNALMEAATTFLLCKKLANEKLSEIFSYMEIANTRSGKIAFIKTLDLLDQRHRRFIHSLAELRNQIVHDIRNVNFNLEIYIERLSKEKFKKFVKKMDAFSYEGFVIEFSEGKQLTVAELFRSYPKIGIFFSAMVTLSIIYLQKEIAEKQNHFIINTLGSLL